MRETRRNNGDESGKGIVRFFYYCSFILGLWDTSPLWMHMDVLAKLGGWNGNRRE